MLLQRNIPVSPYLSKPRRGIRHACLERALHRGNGEPPCEGCPLHNLCLISADEPDVDLPLPGDTKPFFSR